MNINIFLFLLASFVALTECYRPNIYKRQPCGGRRIGRMRGSIRGGIRGGAIGVGVSVGGGGCRGGGCGGGAFRQPVGTGFGQNAGAPIVTGKGQVVQQLQNLMNTPGLDQTTRLQLQNALNQILASSGANGINNNINI
ncbi:hypothetical protein MP638_007295 [Amoeboaphelidium occidentale]|nr:hypothetical protein MP638_007295 [Amoeboaphelidium occidentale]